MARFLNEHFLKKYRREPEALKLIQKRSRLARMINFNRNWMVYWTVRSISVFEIENTYECRYRSRMKLIMHAKRDHALTSFLGLWFPTIFLYLIFNYDYQYLMSSNLN